MTRKEKRKIITDNNFFGEFLIIKKHFFKELFVQLKNVKDIRQAGKVIYTPDILFVYDNNEKLLFNNYYE